MSGSSGNLVTKAERIDHVKSVLERWRSGDTAATLENTDKGETKAIEPCPLNESQKRCSGIWLQKLGVAQSPVR